MPNQVRDGLKAVANDVTEEKPVHFHQHNSGHFLTCALNIIDVETELQGRVRLLPGDVLWVDAGERHRLTAPAGPAKFSCIGKEGF